VTLRFTDAAVDLVCSASDGVPRVINLVCDRTLARAARTSTMRLDAEHVLGAIDDLRLPVARGLRSPMGTSLNRKAMAQSPSVIKLSTDPVEVWSVRLNGLPSPTGVA
jgi:hypothetical protein